jgi:hypothetical protein
MVSMHPGKARYSVIEIHFVTLYAVLRCGSGTDRDEYSDVAGDYGRE